MPGTMGDTEHTVMSKKELGPMVPPVTELSKMLLGWGVLREKEPGTQIITTIYI